MRKYLRKIAAGALIAASVLTAADASAEQAAAARYREMFASGNFYVKYGVGLTDDSYFSRSRLSMMLSLRNRKKKSANTAEKYEPVAAQMIIAGYDGKRAHAIFMKTLSMSMGGFFSGPKLKETGHELLYSEALYSEGNYYRVDADAKHQHPFAASKSKPQYIALVLPEEKLNLPTLNPDEGWGMIRKDLSIPAELAIFCQDDPYRDDDFQSPYFTESSKRTVNKNEYDCDEYAVDTKSVAGDVISRDIYRALYEKGRLVYVQRFFVHDGREDLVSMIDVQEIFNAAPPDLFEFPNGTEIYAADEGKMHDLTEERESVENISTRSR